MKKEELKPYYESVLRDCERQLKVLLKCKKYLESVNYENELWMPTDLKDAVWDNIRHLEETEISYSNWLNNIKEIKK